MNKSTGFNFTEIALDEIDLAFAIVEDYLNSGPLPEGVLEGMLLTFYGARDAMYQETLCEKQKRANNTFSGRPRV